MYAGVPSTYLVPFASSSFGLNSRSKDRIKLNTGLVSLDILPGRKNSYGTGLSRSRKLPQIEDARSDPSCFVSLLLTNSYTET